MPANFGWLRLGAASVVIAVSTYGVIPARATDVVAEWSTIQMPPAPTLKPVTIEPKTTALFLLDFMHENCGHTHSFKRPGEIRGGQVLLIPTQAHLGCHRNLHCPDHAFHQCGRLIEFRHHG